MDSNALIDRIYEAALLPVLWPSVLDELGAATGGNGGMLFAVRDGYVGSVHSARHDETWSLFLQGGWSERDPTLGRAAALNHAGFLNDADLLTEDELKTNDVYCNFYRKHGLDYRAGTVIPMPIGDSVAIVIPRTGAQGPAPRAVVTFLNSLRPHLARAALTANRLGFERARAQAEALQALGLPAAVLRGHGYVLTANALFERMMPSVFQDRAHRLTVMDDAADGLLGSAFASLVRTSDRSVRSIAISATDERIPMVLHVVPVTGAAQDIFTQATALLVVTPVDRAAVPAAEVLQGLFDLTPAEARVARGIGQAQTVDSVALALGVSRETVRTQLKAVLAKTGVARQAELVNLLTGAHRIG
jgi:DNA-binding CsgD family transcriptional regulator